MKLKFIIIVQKVSTYLCRSLHIFIQHAAYLFLFVFLLNRPCHKHLNLVLQAASSEQIIFAYLSVWFLSLVKLETENFNVNGTQNIYISIKCAWMMDTSFQQLLLHQMHKMNQMNTSSDCEQNGNMNMWEILFNKYFYLISG